MLNSSMSKSEIVNALEGKGNFVQIDYLTKFLQNSSGLNRDVKKFVFLKLAEIYERVLMLNESAKMYDSAGMISIRFSEKIGYFVKEAELYIRKGSFENVDEAMRKALYQANVEEKREIYFEVKKMYLEMGRKYFESGKRAHAARIYEKLLEMNPSFQERKELKEKLLDIYKRLGEVRKYNMMKGLD